MINKDNSKVKPAELFTPVGALVLNYADLFPWLSTGFFASLVEFDKMKPILKWRRMIQDFMGLSSIYYMADDFGLKFDGEEGMIQIADSFNEAKAKLQKEDIEDYQQLMDKVYNELIGPAQKIYDVWQNADFLRNAELGLGVVQDSLSLASIEPVDAEKEKVAFFDKIIPPRFIKDFLANAKEWVEAQNGVSYDTKDTKEEEKGKVHWEKVIDHRKNVKLEKCLFDPANRNLDAFAKFEKLYPIIMLDGSIRAFNASGYLGQTSLITKIHSPFKGVTKLDRSISLDFNPIGSSTSSVAGKGTLDIAGAIMANILFTCSKQFIPFRFTIDNAEKCLKETHSEGIKLYSIPFEAAKNVRKWKGVATGIAGLASSEDITIPLAKYRETLNLLSKNDSLRYSSTQFKGLNIKDGYGREYLGKLNIKPRYISILKPEEDTSGLEGLFNRQKKITKKITKKMAYDI